MCRVQRDRPVHRGDHARLCGAGRPSQRRHAPGAPRTSLNAAVAPESTVFPVDVDRDTAEWKLDYWAGTIEQLIEAAHLSLDKVCALVPYPDGYDPKMYEAWKKADSIHKVQIVVEEKDGFTAHPKDLDALASINTADVHRIGTATNA
jgi:hypothetical protein